VRGKKLKPTQATGTAGDGIWRRRLLGRLNDIDNQEFADGLGLQTGYKQQTQSTAVAIRDVAPAQSPHNQLPPKQSPNALLLATITSQRHDQRSLDQVSGEVVDAWQDVDARREKLVLARHSAMHLAQRSRTSLYTAGITGLLGVGTAIGIAALQVLSQSNGESAIVASILPQRATVGEKLGINWAEGFANTAKPVAEAARVAHNTLPASIARASIATAASPTQRKAAQVEAAAAQLTSSSRSKDQNVLPEPSKLSFNVALDGAGERTALLPLRLSDASPEDRENTILVRNMPALASLSAGVRLKSGEWALQLGELAELQIFLPAGTSPIVDLDLRVVRPRGEVVARTQIVLTTDSTLLTTVAAAPVAKPVIQANLGLAAIIPPQHRDGAMDATTKPHKVEPAKAAPIVASKIKTEAHAALPTARTPTEITIDPADKNRRTATAKQNGTKKADEYNALGADVAARDARLRNDQADAKPEPAKTWLGSVGQKQPNWMPNQNNQ
jgi:hypothetical protein